MLPDPSPDSQLSPDWLKVLEKAQQSVALILQDTLQREKDMEPQPEPPSEDQLVEWPLEESFQVLEQRLDQVPSFVQQADRKAADVDAVLQEMEKALKDWLAATASLRRKLGKGEAYPL